MNKLIFSCLLFLGIFAGVNSASATHYTWKGEGDGVTWTDPANWDQGAGYPGISSADIADFDGNGIGDPLYIDPGSSSNPVIIPSSTPITISQLLIDENSVTVYLNTNSNVLSANVIVVTYTLILSPTSKITMLPGTGTGAGNNDIFINAGTLTATQTTFNFGDYSYLYNNGALTTTQCTFNFTGMDSEFVCDGGPSVVGDVGSAFNFSGNSDGSLYSITVYFSKTVGGYPLKNGGTSFTTKGSTFTFSGTYTSPGTAYALYNAATFILDPTSVLNLNSASSTVFNLSSKYFIFASDATGSATLGPVAHGTGAFGGSGGYYVQRYITAQTAKPPGNGAGYRLLSAPVYYFQAAGGAGVSPVNFAFLNATAPLPILGSTKGAYIGATAPATGFNVTSNNPTLYLYDEGITPVSGSLGNFINGKPVGVNAITVNSVAGTVTEGYTSSIIGSGTKSLMAGAGFMLYYIGNTGTFNTTKNGAVPATTISWYGKMNTGTIPFYNWLTNTAGLTYASTAIPNRGVNLVGNPYASAIDLLKVGADNVTASGNQTYYELGTDGNYVTVMYHTASGGSLTSSSGSPSSYQYIAEGESFFVLAESNGQAFNFNETQKSTVSETTIAPLTANFLASRLNSKLTEGSTAALSSTAGAGTATRALIQPGQASMHIALQNSNVSSSFKSCGIYFQPSATDSFNSNDALDLDGVSPSLYMSSFTSDGSRVAINTAGDYAKGKIIKLFVNGTTSGTYTLNLTDIANIDYTAVKVLLIDNYAKDTVDFVNNTSYNFTISTSDSSSYGANRFAISIKRIPAYRLLSFASIKDKASITLNWKATNDGDFTGYGLEKLDATTNAYKTIYSVQSNGSASGYSFVDKTPSLGVNTYRLLQNNIDSATSYSRSLSVTFNNNVDLGALSVYPNPAKDVVTVNFNNVTGITSDIYNVNIYNSMGLLIMQKSISANSLSQDVSALKPGAYVIEVKTNYGNSIGNAKFVKN